MLKLDEYHRPGMCECNNDVAFVFAIRVAKSL